MEESKNKIRDNKIAFRIIEETENSFQTAQFKVILELNNGEKFETTTKPILVRK
jgi:hypothetical protein